MNINIRTPSPDRPSHSGAVTAPTAQASSPAVDQMARAAGEGESAAARAGVAAAALALAAPQAQAAQAMAQAPQLPFTMQVAPEQLAQRTWLWNSAPAGPQGWSRGVELDCMKIVQGSGMSALHKGELAVEVAERDVAMNTKTINGLRGLLNQIEGAVALIEQQNVPALADMKAMLMQDAMAKRELLQQHETQLQHDGEWLERKQTELRALRTS